VYRILRRDPEREPLSALELALFERTTLKHVEAEFNPRAERALVTGHPGNE
jgi:hypothetical protein